jgi:hypothetical protein
MIASLTWLASRNALDGQRSDFPKAFPQSNCGQYCPISFAYGQRSAAEDARVNARNSGAFRQQQRSQDTREIAQVSSTLIAPPRAETPVSEQRSVESVVRQV